MARHLALNMFVLMKPMRTSPHEGPPVKARTVVADITRRFCDGARCVLDRMSADCVNKVGPSDLGGITVMGCERCSEDDA